MSNPYPFHNIHSLQVSIETHEDGSVFVLDHSTGERLPCCPTCLEPYMLKEDFDRGCVNTRCPKHNKDNFPYWTMTDMGPDLCDPWQDNRKEK